MKGILGHAGLLLNIYDTDAQVLFSRYSSPPSGAVKNKINTLIVSLKESGIWDLWDMFYVPAKSGEQVGGLCDWKRPTKVATLNGGVTWDNTNGFVGDAGITSCVNLDYIPSTMGVNYTLHNASAGAYFTAASGTDCVYFGCSSSGSAVLRLQRFSASSHYSTVNSSAGGSAFDVASLNVANKLISCQRYGSGTNTSCYLYADGVETGTTDVADAGGLPSVSMYALAQNSGGAVLSPASGSIAAIYAGAALSGAQMIALNSYIEEYLA